MIRIFTAAYVAIAVSLFGLLGVTLSSAHASEPISLPACQLYRFNAPAACDKCEWEVPDSDVDVFRSSGGSIVIWVPSPRRLPIVRRVTGKDGKQVADLIDLKVTGEQPGPLPVKPDVKPDPAKPDVKPDIKPQPQPAVPLSPFAQRVHDEACKIQSPDRAAQARKIAGALAAVRSKIVAGAIDTSSPANVVSAIKQQTGKQPAVWSDWIRWWNVAGRAEFEKSGKMTPGNWLDLLDGTCEGLSAIK